ncbi:ParB/RepB/Spo0J family partition protein [Acidipila sp. EB88]|uniref:ParB/RepB/Spo0J family partition protein n=1 Tax=Acidipila sp. EB88 TaxID=2305226 RepID=UPI001F1995D3|nr:ParB/RepB/Spo0J family partition protein [Acidipila sp. EB88]
MEAKSKRRALGKGLESLLPKATPRIVEAAPAEPGAQAAAPPAGKALEIALDQIDRNPYQTRTRFEEAALEELASSIRAVGVIQPILVRPVQGGRYQLIAGERRWLASQRAEKATVPAIVATMNDTQAMEATIVENLQRADLNAMEQARAFERLGREFHMTQEQIATRTGKDRASVSNFLRLLRLPAELQQVVEAGGLSFGHARALLSLESPEQMMRAAQKIQVLAMSVRQAETFVKGILNPERREEKHKPVKPVDPNVREMEKSLQETLGLRVWIEDKKGRGRVVIEYSDLEDFDGLIERLTVR